MRAVLTALLLLVQLQPVFGTVACLGLSERAVRQECTMPEHGQAPSSQVEASGTGTQNCELATLCVPATLALPGFRNHLESAVPSEKAAKSLPATFPLDISLAPPFHPPRA